MVGAGESLPGVTMAYVCQIWSADGLQTSLMQLQQPLFKGASSA
jgi:hypothetical protein